MGAGTTLEKLKQAPSIWSLIGIFVMAGALVATWKELPARLTAVENKVSTQAIEIVELRRANSEISEKLDRLTCYVEALALNENPFARGCARR